MVYNNLINRFFSGIFKISKLEVREYFAAIIVGAISGLLVVGFEKLLFFVVDHFFMEVTQINRALFFQKELNGIHTFFLFIIPVLGGIITASIIRFFHIEHSFNINHVIQSFHKNGGRIPLKDVPLVFITTFTTIGMGSPTGFTSPVAFLCSSIASNISRFFHADASFRKTILLAGMAGGIGALLKSPIGAAILTIESLYSKDIEFSRLVPCIFSSSVAYLVGGMFYGFGPLFEISNFFFSPKDIGVYIVLSLYCILVGRLYIVFFRHSGRFIRGVRIPLILKGAIGGAIFGLAGMFFPSLFNFGTLNMSNIFLSSIPYDRYLGLSLFFFFLALLKITTLSIYIHSNGGVGGVFAPTLNIGGFVGASYGCLMCYFFPNHFESIIPFVLVAMCGFYSGVSKTIIGIVVMFLEITGNFKMVPAFSLVSLLVVISLRGTIYNQQHYDRSSAKKS